MSQISGEEGASVKMRSPLRKMMSKLNKSCLMQSFPGIVMGVAQNLQRPRTKAVQLLKSHLNSKVKRPESEGSSKSTANSTCSSNQVLEAVAEAEAYNVEGGVDIVGLDVFESLDTEETGNVDLRTPWWMVETPENVVEEIRRVELPIPSRLEHLNCRLEYSNYQSLLEHFIDTIQHTEYFEVRRECMSHIGLIVRTLKMQRKIADHDISEIPDLVKSSLASEASVRVHELSLKVLLVFSMRESCKRLIVRSGGFERIADLLRIGSGKSRERSAMLLFSLCLIHEHKVQVKESNAIPALVGLLDEGNTICRKVAVTTLTSLCAVRGNRLKAVECGLVEIVVFFLEEGRTASRVGVKDECMELLMLLSTTGEGRFVMEMINIAPLLFELLQHCSSSLRNKEAIAGTLFFLYTQGASIVRRTGCSQTHLLPRLEPTVILAFKNLANECSPRINRMINRLVRSI